MTDQLNDILVQHVPINYGQGPECRGCETFERVSFDDCPVQPFVARVHELETWIEKYGEHGDECMAGYLGVYPRNWPCSCGLKALVGK